MTAEQARMLKHELRTPINHIIGYSELLLETAIDEGEARVTQQAERIHRDGQRLAALVDSHLAGFTDGSTPEFPEGLRLSLTPVIAAIIANAEPELADELVWTQDLRRIQLAAHKLSLVLDPRGEGTP